MGCEMTTYSMSFDGSLLKRGFWLYVWDIQTQTERYLYVARTGDSSSSNAASPFARIGQHLDFRNNAKANSIARRLKENKIDPLSAKFEMLAIGPLFPEQSSFADHKVYRDQMAALEKALAEHLRKNGYIVLGNHQSKKEINAEKLKGILKVVNKRFPPINKPAISKSTLSSKSLNKAAHASLQNARELLKEVELLNEHSYYARALSLAIIGQEELGKAVIFAAASLGLFPGLRERLSKRGLHNPAFEHELKQLLMEYWGIALWQTEEWHQELGNEIGWENWTAFSDVEWLEELFNSISKEDPSSTDILKKFGKAKKIIKKLRLVDLENRTTDEIKQAGFYIDLKPDGSISKPLEIAEIDSRVAIGELEASLNDFIRLERALTNDEVWKELEERIGHG